MHTERNRKLSLDLVGREEIELFTSSPNAVIRFIPHQSYPIGRVVNVSQVQLPQEEAVDLPCVCQKRSGKGGRSKLLDFISQRSKEDPTCTIWMNPSKMPISCFLSSFAVWMKTTEDVAGTTVLGVVVPEYPEPVNSDGRIQIWSVSARGTVLTAKEIENAVWYPSLARSESELLSSSANLNIFRVFPITEVSCEAGTGSYSGTTGHISLLDENRMRTEKIMYVNSRTPNETFEYLVNSIDHLPRRPVATTPILTPGGGSRGYLAMALAAAVTDSLLLLDSQETFSKSLSNDHFLVRSEA